MSSAPKHDEHGEEDYDGSNDHSHGGGAHGEHEEGGHGEPWLVSYADLMTLLFGFFVLMYSFEAAKNSKASTTDPELVAIRKEVAKFFGGPQADRLESVSKSFEKAIERLGLMGDMKITPTANGFQVVLSSTFLFGKGEYELTPKARELVETLVQLIYVRGDNFDIRVEGYSDDSPAPKDSPFKSNWDLSAVRASAVVRVFEENGYKPERLWAIGMGSARPIVPNRDAEGNVIPANRAQNRRVTIFVNEN